MPTAVPASVFPVAGLCVGYPAHEARFSMGLPLAATVHTDRYDTGALAALVRRLRAQAGFCAEVIVSVESI